MEIYKGETRIPVLQVYQMVMQQAKSWRDRAKALQAEGKKGTDVDLYHALASELYAVAANLEATEEVNPTFIELHTQLTGGIPLGKIIERDGRKWKVVDNKSDILTRAELVR